MLFLAFLKSKHKKFREFSLLAAKKKTFKCAWAMTRTVRLHCPISAEIRPVDSNENFVIVMINGEFDESSKHFPVIILKNSNDIFPW